MRQFIEQMSQAMPLARKNDLEQALVMVNEAFNALLYDESDEPIELDAIMIKCIDDARRITELVVALPEIEDTDYINDTLEDALNAIEAYLQDEIEAEQFWEYVIELAKLVHYLRAVAKYLADNGMNLGTDPDPSASIALDAEGNISLYGRLAEDGMSMEKANELQQQFVNSLANENTSATQLINLAGQLLTGQRYEEAIKVYEGVIIRFPNETAQCLNSIGACYYYLGEYETAIEYYMKALEAGEVLERVDYNVWESCDALIKATDNRNEKMKWKYFYEENFPDGEQTIEL